MRKQAFYTFLLSIVVGLPTAPSFVYAGGKKADEPLAKLKYTNGSESENELKALKAEVLITKSEEQAIAQIQKLLRKYKGTTLEPDLLLRLGELYMRRAKTDKFLELHRESDVIVKVAPKMVSQAKSKNQIEAAIGIYDQIQKRFPRYERLDIVIFNNAFANQQLGKVDRAEKLYRIIVKDFANSPIVPDSHLALGEMHFNQREFKLALNHFAAIRKYPNSMVYPYGLYKAGWAYYNMHDATAAMKELEDVIQYGRFVSERGIDSRLDLRKEALLDLALFYEDALPAKDAFRYFKTQARELDASPVILKLSKLYKRHSRHQDNKVVLTDFIKNLGTSDHVPMAYVELMDSSEKMKKYNDVVMLLESLNKTCDPDSKWSEAQKQASVVAKDSPLSDLNENMEVAATPAALCSKLFEKTSLNYANRWLKQWQKVNTQTELADASEKAFALYLTKAPATEESAKARFIYAELLFNRQKFRLASEQYALAAKGSKDKLIGHDGRYFALISLEKEVGDKWSDSDENQFKGLAKDYILTNPTGKFALDVEFKTAFIAYQKKRYDESAPIFLKLGQKFNNTEKGLRSQDLYLDILNAKKDYVGVRDYAFGLRAGTKDADRKEKMTKLYEEAYFFIVQNKESAGNYVDAIKEYQAFADKNPKSPLAQKALWNIVQLQFKANDPLAGASAAIAYFEKYPDTKEGKDGLTKAAQTYESMGQLKDAALVVTKLAKVDPANEEKWNLMGADFYMLSGGENLAKPLYEKLKKSSNKETSFHALNQLVDIADRGNQVREHESLLKEVISTGREPSASLAQLHFVENEFDAGHFTQAFDLAKKIIGNEKDGASKTALAKARLVQARILAQEFKNQSVKSQIERLQLVLQIKTEKLEKAQIAYQSAARYGDAEVAVIAYRELADCYLHYSEALQNMPTPKGLPEADLQVLKDEITKLAIPMEERGIETKMLALKTAREFHTGNAGELQSEIGKLNQTVSEDTTPRINSPAMLLPKVEGAGS